MEEILAARPESYPVTPRIFSLLAGCSSQIELGVRWKPPWLRSKANFLKPVIRLGSVQSDGVAPSREDGMKLKLVLLLTTAGFATVMLTGANSQTRSKKNV